MVSFLTKGCTVACEQQTHFRSSPLFLRKQRLRIRAAKRFPWRKTFLANQGLALKIKELTRETSRKIVCGGYELKRRRSLSIAALFSQNVAFTKVNLPGLWDWLIDWVSIDWVSTTHGINLSMWILIYSFSDTYYVWAACDSSWNIDIPNFGYSVMNSEWSELDSVRLADL